MEMWGWHPHLALDRKEVVCLRMHPVIKLDVPFNGQLLFPPLVFDIRTPSANLIYQKSKSPHYPEIPPPCLQVGT